MNIYKLKGKIVENNISVDKLAETMSISRSTLYRKLRNGGESLMIKEIYMLVDILKLTPKEASDIFFG